MNNGRIWSLPQPPANGYSQALTPHMPPATYQVQRPINYLQVLRNGKWTLLGCLALGIALATLLVWKSPYTYQTRALLEIQGINENLLNSRDVNPAARADNMSESFINTQARILQSFPVFERVANRLNAERGKAGGDSSPAFTPQEIQRSVQVRTRPVDRIVELVATSTNPQRAATIANTVVNEYIQQDMDSRWEVSRRTSQWLTKQLGELDDKLRRSEKDLQDFTRKNNLVIDSAEGSVAEAQLRHVENELARAQAERMQKQAVYEGVKSGTGTTERGVLPDPTLQQYQVQLTTQRRELAELEAIYAPDYYKVQRARAQLESLEKAANKQRSAVLEQLEDDYRTAERREKLLEGQYSNQFRATADQNSKMVRYNTLKSAVELNRTIYGDILQRVKGYGVASALQASNVRIIEPAPVPQRPSSPNKPLIAGMGGFLALFVGMAAMLVRAAGKHNIQEPGEAQLYMQSPELGVIPSAKAASPGYSRLRNPEAQMRALETVAWDSNSSQLAESFRSTSASLLLARSRHGGPRVILVTSLNASEGKTTVASNLAISLAGVAGRVLLIDGDRRRGRLHRVFDRPNDKGLSEILMSGGKFRLHEYVTDTPVPQLFLMTSGKATLPTSDLLYSEEMASLIRACRTEFDMVVIDTPPVVALPDARIIGRLSDGVVLVLRAGRVHSESAVAAEQRLRNDGIPVLGTVLNDWDPRTNGRGVYPHDYERAYR